MNGEPIDIRSMYEGQTCPYCDGIIHDGVCSNNGRHQICEHCNNGFANYDTGGDAYQCTNVNCELNKPE